MSSIAKEDYLKHIALLQEPGSTVLVSMGTLARQVGVVPGTATSMVKKLAGDKLVRYEPYGGVRLTAKGKRLAMGVLRRHRLIETLLVDALRLDWSEVHEDAERLEHVVSEKLLDRIDEFLGFPKTDPHGDPIPDASGKLPQTTLQRLDECEKGDRVRVARILDQGSVFLAFIDAHELRPGARIRVETRDTTGDAIIVRLRGGSRITMGAAAAGKLLVELSD